jgi:hypothetical protein
LNPVFLALLPMRIAGDLIDKHVAVAAAAVVRRGWTVAGDVSEPFAGDILLWAQLRNRRGAPSF